MRVGAIVMALTPIVGCSDDGASVSTTTFGVTARPTTTTSGETTVPTEPTEPTEPTTPAVTIPLVEGAVVLTPYSEGFSSPVDLAWRAGDPAIYIVEQDGVIYPVVDGIRGEAVLSMSELLATGSERGLLGLAFDPQLPLAYINYTDNSGDTVIAELAIAEDGTLDKANRRVVMTIDQPYENHNGGDLAFGPDGYLYIGVGDGGSGGDPERRSLVLGELLGKILRIDPHVSGDQPYSVPADNPFVGVDGARHEIWSIGVRNPWRLNFDPATGDLWFGDVGQDEWEEVNVARAAAGGGRAINYGWSAFEGTHRYNDDQSPDGATPPIYEYSHNDGGCSVSGGTVYRGSAIPALTGWYLFSDYCSGVVSALIEIPGAAPTVLALAAATSVSAIVDGPDGELYVLDYATGTVFRLDAA